MQPYRSRRDAHDCRQHALVEELAGVRAEIARLRARRVRRRDFAQLLRERDALLIKLEAAAPAPSALRRGHRWLLVALVAVATILLSLLHGSTDAPSSLHPRSELDPLAVDGSDAVAR